LAGFDTMARAAMRALLLIPLLFCILVAGRTEHGEERPVVYRLSYAAPGGTSVHVRIELPSNVAGTRALRIPRAVPMGYTEEPYDRFVSNVRAFDSSGKVLEVSRADGPRWRVGSAARVEYDVDLARMEQAIHTATDSSRVRPNYASVLGYSVFGFFDGAEELPIELQVEAPQGWPVFSTLAPSGGPIRAENFYALADSQILLGPGIRLVPVHYSREAQAPLTLALYSEVPVDPKRLERLSGEAMAAVLDYFVDTATPPFAHFSVLLEFLTPLTKDHSYGFGMEHLESFHSALASSDADPAAFPDDRLRYHIAHHMAHAWIPKRCYGEGYYPFNWDRAPKIDTIWFSEGFAQYAAIAALATSEERRQQMLDRRFRSVLREAPPELRRLPLRELSLLASTQYASDFRIGQLTFSRGGLMAAEMDDRIRAETHGQKSLRDALRHLVAWSAENRRAFRIDELPVRFREATGVETRDILDRWLAPLH
jgi:predicted metalloprotease with PDZ domain